MSAAHGNTPAAWTAVTIMFVGCLVSALAIPLALPWLFFVGLVVGDGQHRGLKGQQGSRLRRAPQRLS